MMIMCCVNMGLQQFMASLQELRQALIVLFIMTTAAGLLLVYDASRSPQKTGMINHYGDNLLVMAKDMKKIVFWTKFFSSDHDSDFLRGQDILVRYCQKPCVISRQRDYPELYDAVVFHTRNYNRPPQKRNPNQVYIAYTFESPSNQGRLYSRGNFYNWSVSVLTESTIPVMYYRTVNRSRTFNRTSLHQFSKSNVLARQNGEPFVLWIVSNCYAENKRHDYVKKLREYIGVDIYGACGKECPKGNCQKKLVQTGRYKFYLAFENSFCQDYITEKTFSAFWSGLVPVVLGGLSMEDYERPGLLPPHSYIDVRNFSSPKHLADYLHRLDGHDEQYLRYFKWRTDYDVTGRYDWLCEVCDRLYDTNLTKPQTLNWETFYNPEELCLQNVVDKLLT